RREAGRFLAEGPQAVREALAVDAVIEMFATADAIERYPELTARADEIGAADAASLSETVTPQGVVAVCAVPRHTVDDVLAGAPRLLVALVAPNDPGNLGTVIRTADAAGADAVVVDAGVDPFNGKAVRASAGSIFHLPVVDGPALELMQRAHRAGLITLATTGHGGRDLDELADGATLARASLWLFGSEAHGLPATVIDTADFSVRVPIHGRAESLNIAAAAAVCLYASARAQRR
ncbi:MAG: RNA methyltransferase, partial [Actinomycetota bacterium]|nr:RNA methyltransferase [Actinomycetota bacterium]